MISLPVTSLQMTCTRLMASFFQDSLGKPASEKHLDFNEARDDRVAVASAGPYANYLHLAPDR